MVNTFGNHFRKWLPFSETMPNIFPIFGNHLRLVAAAVAAVATAAVVAAVAVVAVVRSHLGTMPSKGWRKGDPRKPRASGRHTRPRLRAEGYAGASGWAASKAKAPDAAVAAEEEQPPHKVQRNSFKPLWPRLCRNLLFLGGVGAHVLHSCDKLRKRLESKNERASTAFQQGL